MAEALGTLLVRLDVDAAEFHGKLGEARGALDGFGSGAAGAIATFAGGMLGGAIAEIGNRALGAIKDFIVQGAAAADQMGKLGERTGIPVAEMSKLVYAADLANVSAGQLSSGLRNLAKGLDDAAAGGTSKASQALRAMGISATDAHGKVRPMADVIKDVADKFRGYEDGAGKAALSQALFGKSGDLLIPMLNQGRAALAEAGAELAAFGGVVTPEAARQGNIFQDNLTRLSWAGRGFALDLAGQLTPALNSLTKSLLDTSREGGVLHGIAVLLGTAIKVLLTPVFMLGAAFEAVGKWIGAFTSAVYSLSQGEIRQAGRIIALAADDITSTIGTSGRRIADMWVGASSEIEKKSADTADKTAAPFVASGKKVKQEADKAIAEAQRAREALQRELGQMAVRTARAEAPKGHEEEARVRESLQTGDLGARLAKLRDPAEAERFREQFVAAAQAADANAQRIAAARAAQDQLNQRMREGAEITRSVRTPLEQYNAEMERLNVLAATNAISEETRNRALAKASDAFRKAAIENDAFLKALDSGWKKFQAGFEDSLVNVMTGKFKGGLREMLASWGQMLAEMVARAIAARIATSIFGGAGGGGGVAALFGGGKAGGGGVDRGTAYVVGERGPELFVPGATGAIVPTESVTPAATRGELTVRIPDLDRLGRMRLVDVVEGYLSDVAAARGTA